jgi:hypothetical protein
LLRSAKWKNSVTAVITESTLAVQVRS